MPRRAASLIPPARRPEQSPAVTLFVEPEDPIRIMGEMIRDADLIGEKLRGLAFSDDHYHADLRVIMGVAVRTKQRCERLLGEAPTAADVERAVGRLADKIVEQVDRDEPLPVGICAFCGITMSEANERSMGMYCPKSADGMHAANLSERPGHWPIEGEEIPDAEPQPAPKPPKKTRAARVRNLGSPAAVPVPGGVRASILKHLARGPRTSAELIEAVGGIPGTVYSTLTALRNNGEVRMAIDESDGLRKNYLAETEAATA